MIPAVEEAGGEIIECDVLVDRAAAQRWSRRDRSLLCAPTLWQLDLPTYEPGSATCPRCADGTPLHAPGSTGTGATAG